MTEPCLDKFCKRIKRIIFFLGLTFFQVKYLIYANFLIKIRHTAYFLYVEIYINQ